MFKPGTRLSYAYEIYNAAGPGRSVRDHLARPGEASSPRRPTRWCRPLQAADRFAAAGGLKLGASLPPGDYVLQIATRTPEAKTKKKGVAVQSVDFEVR